MLYIYIFFCTYFFLSNSFTTLQEIQEYARLYPEFPSSNTTNITKPNYTTFHKQLMVSPLKRWLAKTFEIVGIKKKPLWTIEHLISLLTTVSTQRKAQGYTGQFVMAFKPSVGTRFIVVGELHAAFHSLARVLQEWYNQKIISEELYLASDYYVVLNGNAINWSAYNLETLTLILLLMHKNPQKVIYIKGTHEHQEHWLDFDLKQELLVRAQGLSSEKIPLRSSLVDFFNTLPFALYLQAQNTELIRIASLQPSLRLFNEAYLSQSLKRPLTSKPTAFSFVTSQSVEPLLIRAIIKSNHQVFKHKASQGLIFLIPEKGAATWSLISAPIEPFKQTYNFFNDAYAILSINPRLQEWTITLYSHNIQGKNVFVSTTYNFMYGYEIKPPYKPLLTKEEIVIGSTLDLSKTSAAAGKRLQQGLSLRVMKENYKGGIRGHPLRLVILDDQYTPLFARQNVIKLLNRYKTNKIIAPLGTPTTQAFLSFVESKKILVLFPYTGATIFRKPGLTNFIHLRTSYINEAKALVTYAINTFQAQRFAVFYQDDSYGQAPLIGAREAFKEHAINRWLEVSYTRNNPNVEQAAQQISNFNPDVILFFSTAAPSQALIQKLGINKITTTIFMGISFLTDILRKYFTDIGLRLILSQVIPSPTRTDIEIIKEYQRDMSKYNPGAPLTTDSLEGYLDASVFIDTLHKIKDLSSNEELIKQFENIKNYNFKGLILNFNPQTRELLNHVWIDTGNNDIT